PLSDLQRLPETVRVAIWQPDLAALPTWHALGLRMLRTFWAVLRDVRQGDLSLRAMSLVYTTMLSMVPLLAISFSVLKGFGVHEELETAMMRVLLPLGERGVEVGIRIVEFVENVKVGVLGSVGLALLLYTVVSLMQKIERAFNHIWDVPQTRPFAQRFSGYLSVIVIGPLLVFSAVGISASLMNSKIVTTLSAVAPIGVLIDTVGQFVPATLVVGAFTFIYVFMPNTRVRVLSAFTGALVGALLWGLASWVFASFIVSSAQYAAIYSGFAALILFMLWLYVAWLVLLIGSSVALYHQHPEDLILAQRTAALSPRMAERLALAVLVEIGAAFAGSTAAPSDEDLAARLRCSSRTVDRLTDLLARKGFITATIDVPARWLPARVPDAILLGDVISAVRAEGEGAASTASYVHVTPSVRKLLDEADAARDRVLESRSLAELVAMTQSHDDAPGADTGVTPLPKTGNAA
ncbi:MAG: YhjD/YihY/BrkB family envelope integrity protein, partial [Alphaproteobacteria bacterium]